MENMIYVAIAVAIISVNVLKFLFKNAAKDTAKQKALEEKTGKKAAPEWTMASPKSEQAVAPEINPAFLEEKNWQEYDMPSYLRKKHDQMLKDAKQVKPNAPAKKSKQTSPKMSMDEFKAAAVAKKADARYEEV